MANENQAPPASTETSADPPKKGDGKGTPEEHARATGNIRELTQEQAVKIGGGTPQRKVEMLSWQHKAAAQLHGWNAHEHHAAGSIRLTRAEYEGALKAATKEVTRVLEKDGKAGDALDAAAVEKLNGTKPLVHRYEPHAPALSPHAHDAPKKKEPS